MPLSNTLDSSDVGAALFFLSAVAVIAWIVGIALIWGLRGSAMAKRRGRSAREGFWLGAFLGPMIHFGLDLFTAIDRQPPEMTSDSHGESELPPVGPMPNGGEGAEVHSDSESGQPIRQHFPEIPADPGLFDETDP